MFVTVAICTWNRSRMLEETLDALAKLAVPDDVEWEVLVVDNASTDDTPTVLERHRTRLPLRGAYEAEQGHSNARNRAVAEARGDLIVWTDDDVVVDEQWIAAYAKVARARPDADFFGGPVLPWFHEEPPSWVIDAMPVIETAFATRDFGAEPFDFDAALLPFGANFAVRTAVQRRHRFDPTLGRVGKGLLSGDESDALRRMLAAGHVGVWVPDAPVRHHIGPERLELDWVRRFYHGIGETDVVAHCREPLPELSRWWRIALCAAKGGIKGTRYRGRRFYADPVDWARDLRDSSIHWGRATAYRRLGSSG